MNEIKLIVTTIINKTPMLAQQVMQLFHDHAVPM